MDGYIDLCTVCFSLMLYILWLIDYKVFLFLWLIPASIACWGVGWAVWRQHWHMEPNNSPYIAGIGSMKAYT
jgi:hypothetical protein